MKAKCPACNKMGEYRGIGEFKEHYRKCSKGGMGKYKAIPTVYRGMRFASKLEAGYCRQLDEMKERGEIEYYLRQVPFPLPGGVKYLCDFMMVINCGGDGLKHLRYVEVKGYETRMGEMKRKQAEEIYGIEIEVVRRDS